MRDLLAKPIVFDGRNLYDPARMAEMGFEYQSIGRPSYAPETKEQFERIPEFDVMTVRDK